MGHKQKAPLKILWRLDLIWLRYLGSKNVYLLVCLFFVYRFVSSFYFNHRGTPTGSFPDNFMNIRFDLAEILRIRKLDWRDRGGGGKGREGKKGRNPTGTLKTGPPKLDPLKLDPPKMGPP